MKKLILAVLFLAPLLALASSPVFTTAAGARAPAATRFSAKLSNSAAVTLTQVQAAPAAGASLYVTDVVVSASAASTTTADQQAILRYGTGTNCATGTGDVVNIFVAANTPAVLHFETPIKLPAANALCFIDAVAGNKSVAVNGYIAP